MEYCMSWDSENLHANSGFAIGFMSNLSFTFFFCVIMTLNRFISQFSSVSVSKQNVVRFSCQSFHLYEGWQGKQKEYFIGNPPLFYFYQHGEKSNSLIRLL